MDYVLLTGQHKNQIALRKLLELESEHHALDLNIRLAVATGIENDSVEAARSQRELVRRQTLILTSWIWPREEDEESEIGDEVVANGEKPVSVE